MCNKCTFVRMKPTQRVALTQNVCVCVFFFLQELKRRFGAWARCAFRENAQSRQLNIVAYTVSGINHNWCARPWQCKLQFQCSTFIQAPGVSLHGSLILNFVWLIYWIWMYKSYVRRADREFNRNFMTGDSVRLCTHTNTFREAVINDICWLILITRSRI